MIGARDELGEHRAIFEEPEHVAEHRARLSAIGRDDRERPTLTGGENATVVAEAREIDRHQGSHAAFAASATDDYPCLARRRGRSGLTSGVRRVERSSRLRDGETEERHEERLPGHPRGAVGKGGGEELGIVEGFKDRHGAGSVFPFVAR